MGISAGQKLMEIFDLLLGHFGPQHWWPGENEIEMIVGAILTQNTRWNNVKKAINNLKKEDLLSIESLHNIPPLKLAAIIRPAGYFNIKTRRLKNLTGFIMERYHGDIRSFLREETDTLREGLISIKGVGPETADSILLYAARRPVFVIDTYTYRILNRHNMADDGATYYELQELFMDSLPEDTKLFNEFHALIVRTGKEYCRRKPLCSMCPLEKFEEAFE